MSTFIIIAAIGYALLAVVAILDKFILTKEQSVPVFTFYSTIFFFAAFLLLPFAESITRDGFWWALSAGLGFGFGTWAMFVALNRGQATHVVPFIGAVTAVFVYGFSFLILGVALSFLQTMGIMMLIAASLLFSYDTEHAKKIKMDTIKKVHPAFGWALLSGFLYSISHVASKNFYGDYLFVTGLVWAQGSVGIVGLCTLFSVAVRKELFGKKIHDNTHNRSKIGVIIADKVFGLGGTLAIQYAIATGSVAVVTGLVGLQYALIMIFAAISTFVAPTFFKEYVSEKEIVLKIVAILLVVAGIILLA